MPGASDWRNWALLAALGMIWGGSFTMTGVAVAELPPLTIAAARLALGALALLTLALASGVGLPTLSDAAGRRSWRAALGVAIAANAIPFALLSWAQIYVPSGLAGVFMASLPLIILPLTHFFVPGEKMTWTKSTGLLLGFLGVVYLIGLDALGDLGGAPIEIWAQMACLLAATGYAVGSIITKRAPATHPFAFGAAAIGLAAVIMGPIAFAVERPLDAAWSEHSIWAVLYLGLGPTALAQILLFITLKRAGPSFVSLVNYQVPLWAVLFGALFLAEAIPERAGLALALILAGVALSQGLLTRLWRRAPSDATAANKAG